MVTGRPAAVGEPWLVPSRPDIQFAEFFCTRLLAQSGNPPVSVVPPQERKEQAGFRLRNLRSYRWLNGPVAVNGNKRWRERSDMSRRSRCTTLMTAPGSESSGTTWIDPPAVVGRSSLIRRQGQVHRMRQSDVDDINRKLAMLAARHGFAAIARNAPLEEGGVVFEAFTWRGAEVLTRTATYPNSKFARRGGLATMIVFVERARSQFGLAGR